MRPTSNGAERGVTQVQCENQPRVAQSESLHRLSAESH
jgi:hypothetical protein